MKKIFAIFMTICLLASALCVTAFAEDPVVMSVYGLKKDGETKVILDTFTDFSVGWEAVVDYAEDHDTMDISGYERIVVDFHADWNANSKGEFGDGGDGFEWSTIHVPGKVSITMNLNGHTINRGLGENNELDGEVIRVEGKADLIINDGTITGGNSDNGAGGLHITDGATVTLNNVNVSKNEADGDNGAGIALYGGSTLIMKGGSISNNINDSFCNEAAGVYLNNSTAIFEGVTFSNNQATYTPVNGTILFLDQKSAVTMKKCEVFDNGTKNAELNSQGSISLIHITGDSRIDITETNFTGNGDAGTKATGSNVLINVYDAEHCYIDNCTFTNNSAVYLFMVVNNDVKVTNSRFLNNPANVLHGYGEKVSFTDCVFHNNPATKWTDYDSFYFVFKDAPITFTRCDMGNSTFNDRSRATFENSGVGSIFGEGSLIMVVAILALVASATSIYISFALYKKKTVPVTTNNATDEDEE